jgi:hypothetical protein
MGKCSGPNTWFSILVISIAQRLGPNATVIFSHIPKLDNLRDFLFRGSVHVAVLPKERIVCDARVWLRLACFKQVIRGQEKP